MSNLAIPFNVSLLVLDDSMLKGVKPVRTLDVFEGMSKNFHEDGLFSQSIFGKVGDEIRSRRFSYIDIKVPIFHPIIFETLGKIKRIYPEIIAGKTYAIFDKTEGDFIKSNQLDGQTGFHFFETHWKQIKFPDKKSDSRELNIQLLKKYMNSSMLSKLVVMPAGLRDYEINADGREVEDEVNVLYRKILSLANSISLQGFQYNPELLNSARYALQHAYNTLYDLLKSSVEGKKKLYMGKWASRAIFNGTRNVATTNNFPINELESDSNPGFNDSIIGLYQYLKATLPVSKYQIRNGFLSKVFLGNSNTATLVDKKTLAKVNRPVSSKAYDLWMSDEGLDKIISIYGEESIRHNPVEIDGYYLGLVYRDDKVFKLFSGLDELPASFDKSKVTPITITELLYLSVYKESKRYTGLVTRYPITGYGSIFPCKILLKPTIQTFKLKELNDNWELDELSSEVPHFPNKGAFFNSVSVNQAHNSTLGLDKPS